MDARGRQRLRPQERLKSAAEYRQVLKRGLRLDGRLFNLIAADNGRDYDRLGIAAGRQVGTAVGRNRARRLLREAFRRNKREARSGCDLVLVAKREIAGTNEAEVESEYRERLRRLDARRATRSHRAGGAGGH